ncbi:hypothetical protein [Lentzea sp.]|uniref:hypothetical protein n=1 Tax=Lentzea sp. TaxID=56099 RepID=UPI002CDE9CBC|nr:hypothetical protein [Lentzea sp.]HUQ59877.1 hypothetical protein [Lentzea sp.]
MISSGDGGTFALFVRDALGISTPTADAIPRLVPPVPRLEGALYPPGLVEDWDRWWRDCTSSGAGREPVGLPVRLREAYRDWGAFTAPENTQRRDEVRRGFTDAVQEVVVDLEHERGHRPIFTLDVLQVPLEGQFWRRLSRGKVLVSEELMLSRNVIAPLESVIRDLLR